jgi:hypothetical protein
VVGVFVHDILEQEEFINESPTTDEIALIEREQEEVINEAPTTDEIDFVEREQEEAINETPTTDEIDLVEREQDEAIQESFQQSLVEIGSVVSEEKIFLKFHPPFFLICIIGQNRQKFKVHKKSCNIY